jgi:predicted transcriptional regulator
LARHYPMRVTKAQLGTLAKFKITGGTFQTYYSTLKREGLIAESGGEIEITQAGLDYVGADVGAPMTTDEVVEQWRTALKAGARKMLDELLAVHPNEISREELAERVEMTESGGTFQTYLGTLRRNGLAEIDGGFVRAGQALFLGDAA